MKPPAPPAMAPPAMTPPAVTPPAEPAWRRALRHAPPAIGVLLLLGAVIVVRKQFRHLRFEDIAQALAHIPHAALLTGLCAAIGAYCVLTLYDLLGSIYAGHRLPYRRVAFASFCAYALSHNLGFSAVSGGAVRFRLYAGWGLTSLQIGKLIAFCSISFGFGGLAIGGGAFLFEPAAVPFLGEALPIWVLHAIGLAMWAMVALYVVLAARQDPVTLFGHCLRLPHPPLALGQIVVAVTDLCTTATIFYALLPHGQGLSFFRFMAIYLMSYSAGLLASLPGGIGVFDTVMLLGLAPYLAAPRIVGAILIFRLYYHIIPLFLAGTLFAGHELLLRGRALLKPGTAAAPATLLRRNENDFAIAAASGAVALSGALLLAIGVIAPAVDTAWIDPAYATGLARAGHFIPSLIGAALLVFAIGLSQRVTLAWGGTLLLLLAGAAFTAIQDHMLYVPGVLVLACFVLAPYREAFYRDARLFSGRIDAEAALPLFALIACILALAVFERHVRFVTSNSWWTIVGSPLVPNSVRVAVGLSVLVGVAALWRLLLPVRAPFAPWSLDARLRYAALGGKPPAKADGLVWGEAGTAAIPFRRIGRVLLGLADPAGEASDRASAIWRLRAVAQAERRDLAVYRVGSGLLDVYGDLGLAALPLGPDGLPLPEHAGGQTPSAYLMCAGDRDVATLLPALPALAGRRYDQAA